MNTRNRFSRALAFGALVVGVIAIASISTIPAARAQRDANQHRAVNVLPPVGIAFGQTLCAPPSSTWVGIH